MVLIRFDEIPKNEVLVAINPSILQRFCGSGYYFYDDIPLPYHQELLVRGGAGSTPTTRNNQILHPSLQEPLLLKDGGNDQHDGTTSLFDPLWIRFCVCLFQHQAKYQAKQSATGCVLLLVVYSIAIGSLSLLLIAQSENLVVELVTCAILAVLWLIPISVPVGELVDSLSGSCAGFFLQPSSSNGNNHAGGVGGDYPQIQQLVDDMAEEFSEHGYHVDYVKDRRPACPSLVYVRFRKSRGKQLLLLGDEEYDESDGQRPSSSSSLDEEHDDEDDSCRPLAERMMAAQKQARQDYLDQRILIRHQEEQEQNELSSSSSSKNSELCLFGIRTETAMAYRPVILLLSIPLVFFFLVFTYYQFADGGFGYGHMHVSQVVYATARHATVSAG